MSTNTALTHYSWWQRPPVGVRDWPVLLTRERQLFVDDHLIAERTNVTRQFHQPLPHAGNPILSPQYPWEGTACMAHGTVLKDESGRLRMYYEGFVGDAWPDHWEDNPWAVYGVAFSDDGLAWERPKLGLYSYREHNDTNLILPVQTDVTRYQQASVIYDPLDADPTRRWKMGLKHTGSHIFMNINGVIRTASGPPKPGGYHAYFSEDGLRWRCHPEPIITDGIVTLKTDGVSLQSGGWPLPGVMENQSIMYDRVRRKFVAFVRIYDCRPGQPVLCRARAVCESDDFLHWTTPRVLFLPLEDDEPGLQFYSSNGWNYESLYLGLLRCYRAGSTGQVYFQLISSRDGIHWERAAHRQPFIANEPAGQIGGGYHSDFSNGPIRTGDELWFYYGSTRFGKNVRPYAGGICLAKLRLDGFASIEGGERTGTLTTRPLDWTGGRLTINASPRANGRVVVEVLDRSGQPLPGYGPQDAHPVTTDHVSAPVRWRAHADLAALVGQTIRLRFHITEAGLYSFQIQ
jgi:hypothetical protein